MALYALVSGGICVTVIFSDAAPTAPGTWIDVTSATPPVTNGTKLIAGVWTFSDSRPRIITRLAFNQRFSVDERADISIAGLDAPTAIRSEREEAAKLRNAQSDISIASFIDLNNTLTRDGVFALQTAGLIASGRAVAILDSAIAESERPT